MAKTWTFAELEMMTEGDRARLYANAQRLEHTPEGAELKALLEQVADGEPLTEFAETKAHDLLRALDLKIAKSGAASGRYPCGEPGPATGFRYWATYTEGRFKFGVQAVPKAALKPEVLRRLRSLRFESTPAETECFVWLLPTLESSVTAARPVMAQLRAALAS
jgi:hypothetical protein